MIRLFSRIGEVTFDDFIHRNFYLVRGGSVNGKALPVWIGDLKPRNFFDRMDIVERVEQFALRIRHANDQKAVLDHFMFKLPRAEF